MHYQGPTYLECDCGEDVDLDDYWQPGDVVQCEYCGLRHTLVACLSPERPQKDPLTRLGEHPDR